MKKLALTIAIVLGICFSSFAQQGGGLFQYGTVSEEETWYSFTDRDGDGLFTLPTLPSFSSDTDEPAAPVGSGVLVLAGLGAAYLAAKKRKED